MIDDTYSVEVDSPLGRKQGKVALRVDGSKVIADIDAPVMRYIATGYPARVWDGYRAGRLELRRLGLPRPEPQELRKLHALIVTGWQAGVSPVAFKMESNGSPRSLNIAMEAWR